MESVDHERIGQELRDHPAKKGLVVTALEIGGAILLFHVVKSQGGSGVVFRGPAAGDVLLRAALRHRRHQGGDGRLRP